MRPFRPGLLLLLCFFVPRSNSAQQFPPTTAATPSAAQPVNDPRAGAVLQGALTAMGSQNLAHINSIQETVLVTTFEGETSSVSKVTLTTGQTTALRMDVDGSSGKSTLVVNGDRAQTQSGSDTPQELPRSAFGNVGLTHVPLLSIVAHWQDQGVILKYVGLEADGNSKVHHVTLQSPLDPSLGLGDHDSPCDVYVDSQTMLITKLVYAIRAPANFYMALSITATYGNYKGVSGLMIPFRIDYSANGTPLSSQVVQDIAVNVPINASEFQLGGAQ